MTFYLFFLICLLILFTALYLKGGNHAPFLIMLFSLSLLARLVIAGYLYYQAQQRGAEGFISSDEALYFYKGLELYDISNTTNVNLLYLILPDYNDPYGFGFMNPLTILSFLHYFIFCFFSVSIIYTKMTAILVGSLTPIIFYFICLRLSGKKTAKLVSVLFSFWPSYFYYSLGGFKEPYLLLLVVVLLGICLLLFEKPKWPLLYLAPPLLLMYFIAHKSVFFSLFLLLSLLVALFRTFEGRQKLFISLLVGAFTITPFLVKNRHLNPFVDKQLNVALSDSAGYFLYPHVIDRSGAPYAIQEGLFSGDRPIFSSWLFILLKGLAYALFSPFLWDIQSKNQLMAYPQSLFMLLGCFFLLRGVCLSLTSYARFFFPIVLTIFIFVVGFSLSEGNIGAAFRHRDLFLPCYLFFFGIGFVQTLHHKKTDHAAYFTARL